MVQAQVLTTLVSPRPGHSTPASEDLVRESAHLELERALPLKTLQEKVDPIPKVFSLEGDPTETHCPYSSPGCRRRRFGPSLERGIGGILPSLAFGGPHTMLLDGIT